MVDADENRRQYVVRVSELASTLTSAQLTRQGNLFMGGTKRATTPAAPAEAPKGRWLAPSGTGWRSEPPRTSGPDRGPVSLQSAKRFPAAFRQRRQQVVVHCVALSLHLAELTLA